MKRIVSNTLYVLFIGFALTLVIACIMLIINISRGEGQSLNDIEAVQLSGAADEDISFAHINTEVLSESSGNYQQVSVHFGYDALRNGKKEYLYDHLMAGIYTIAREADENGRYRLSRIRVHNYKLSEFDIREVVNAFIYDNPQYFWIENLFGYAYAEDDTIVEFYSVLSASDCDKYIKRFNEKVGEILSSIESGKTAYQRERIVHDTITRGCTYKTGIKSSSDGWEYFTAYGALVGGEAVCEGYAKSMQVLLTRVGVQCSMIRGDAGGVAHMWNVVELGGEWYHVDPTWDDVDSENSISYEYFNIPTDQILKNHTICDDIANIRTNEDGEDPDPLIKYNFYVPMCTSREMNYYQVEGILIRKLDKSCEEAVSALIKDKALKGETYVPIRFGAELTYSEYINKLFYESPYLFYYCLENVNRELDPEQRIDAESVFLLKNEDFRTLRVRLNYGEPVGETSVQSSETSSAESGAANPSESSGTTTAESSGEE